MVFDTEVLKACLAKKDLSDLKKLCQGHIKTLSNLDKKSSKKYNNGFDISLGCNHTISGEMVIYSSSEVSNSGLYDGYISSDYYSIPS